jgi:hypothetical protein
MQALVDTANLLQFHINKDTHHLYSANLHHESASDSLASNTSLRNVGFHCMTFFWKIDSVIDQALLDLPDSLRIQ